MELLQEQLLRKLEAKSRRRVGRFALELITAKPEDKEEILAGIEVEGFLAEVCRECLSE